MPGSVHPDVPVVSELLGHRDAQNVCVVQASE
eukprot:COSAG06_NODE_48422_length_332_cov_0.733906_1_plen_31_part_10